MDKKKKIMIVVVLAVAVGGIMWYLKKKKGQQASGGASGGGGQVPLPNAKVGGVCQGVKEALGGGKGKYLAIADKKGSEGRKSATKNWKVGMSVSVDGGTPTKITKLWKDTNKQVGAVMLADGTANGKTMCEA